MKGILARFMARKRPDLATIIARRAQRVCNRKPELAQAYEARHRELAKGRK